ncbi:SERF family protein [Carpediemonas membranifera]|uniref:SERF family protein n=1 Tax=Carpediemonas membranifera TaxID=201153 RepID=A0A8J6AVR9_9EUKA|nr:SERF family protein [Carpediemonas membranifera]|eukprot:KAG9393740.1 SERF family protein [Carpediemonas membranifera]
MARGNQRELSRARNAKQNAQNAGKDKSKAAKNARAEAGVSFANDRERQAQIMRDKQKAAEEKRAAAAAGKK